jgi:hypothetical protein
MVISLLTKLFVMDDDKYYWTDYKDKTAQRVKTILIIVVIAVIIFGLIIHIPFY